jgi:hypothetical protein
VESNGQFKKQDNVYKCNLIPQLPFKRSKNMQQKNEARHCSNYQVAIETSVTVEENKPEVPSQKRKEDAKQILYLNRV